MPAIAVHHSDHHEHEHRRRSVRLFQEPPRPEQEIKATTSVTGSDSSGSSGTGSRSTRETTSPQLPETTTTTTSKIVSPPRASKVEVKEEITRYPINLPSPILLGTSMILAIASTGTY
jgi:hypothetical protein